MLSIYFILGKNKSGPYFIFLIYFLFSEKFFWKRKAKGGRKIRRRPHPSLTLFLAQPNSIASCRCCLPPYGRASCVSATSQCLPLLSPSIKPGGGSSKNPSPLFLFPTAAATSLPIFLPLFLPLPEPTKILPEEHHAVDAMDAAPG